MALEIETMQVNHAQVLKDKDFAYHCEKALLERQIHSLLSEKSGQSSFFSEQRRQCEKRRRTHSRTLEESKQVQAVHF